MRPQGFRIATLMRRWPTPLPVRLVASLVLVAASGTSAFSQDDAAELLGAGFDAAVEERWEQAVLAAEQTLGRAASGPLRDGALLLRSLCRFEAGDHEPAGADLASIADPPALAGRDWLHEEAIGIAFLEWARLRGVDLPVTARRIVSGTAPLPEISLEELNPEVASTAVASHFVMDVEIVRIPVIVTGEHGGFMRGLQAEEFSVMEGGAAAQPIYQMIADDEPTSLGILVDGSSAVAENIDTMRSLLASLLASLRPQDEAFVVRYDDTAAFLSDFRAAADYAPGAFADFAAGGRRALYDAVALGLIRMRAARNDKKSLVVVAAGDDLGSRVTQDALRLAAQREGVAIHLLMLASGLDRWRPGTDAGAAPTYFLQQLSHQTGGLVALRPAIDERYGGLSGWLELAVGDLAAYIKNQYLLLFESYDPPPHGEWRSLAVRVSRLHDTVRARSGYVR